MVSPWRNHRSGLVPPWFPQSINQSINQTSSLAALLQEQHRLFETTPEQMAVVCDMRNR